MGIVETDLKCYAPLNNPADFTSTLGGGIDETDEIDGNCIGELIYRDAANSEGGADKVRYAKGFIKNTNGSDDYYNASIWIRNSLLSPSADGTVSIVSSSASDDTGYYIKMIFENAAGTKTSENITLNGTSAVTSTGSVKASTIPVFELRLVSDNSLTAANGDITFTRGITLGKIPSGGKTAQGGLQLALEGSLDDTETTTDRTTAPAAVSFSLAQDEASGIDVANSGTLTHGSAQGFWIKVTYPDGQLSSSDLECDIYIDGTDA